MWLIGLEGQGANRANGDALAAIPATGSTDRFISKRGDHPSEAAVRKADHSLARFLLAYPDASAAQHALVGVVNEQRTAGVYR
jgi:hypothetical protein